MADWTRLRTNWNTTILTLSTALLAGCSQLQQVSQDTNAIRVEAHALVEYGKKIGDKEVIDRAGRIDNLAAGIHDRLPSLEDKVPAWISTLWMVGLAIVALSIVVLLWQTGLGTAIRVAIGWIPRRKIQDADLASGMLNPDKPEDAREYVAARRASDPEFDSAWRRIHKKDNK